MANAEFAAERRAEMVRQFMAVTQQTDEELATALLASCSWNLDVAIGSALDGRAPPSAQVASPPRPTSRRETPPRLPPTAGRPGALRQRAVGRPSPPSTGAQPPASGPAAVVDGDVPAETSIVSRLLQWLSWPLRMGYSFTGSVLAFVFAFFQSLVPGSVRAAQSRHVGEQLAAFGATAPRFHSGTYNEAVSVARRDLRFLLVYLHSPQHADTSAFCREVLCAETVAAFIDDNFVSWAGNVATREGSAVAAALRVTGFPYVGLLVAHEGAMRLVYHSEGQQGSAQTAESFLDTLVGVMERFQPVLVSAQADRLEREATTSIRREQDTEYERSLAADREKEARRKAEIEAQAAAEQAEREAQAARLRAMEDEKLSLESRRANLPEPPAEGEPAVRLAIRCPGGRLERRFAPTDLLQSVHDYVACSEGAPAAFSLWTSHPKAQLTDMALSLDAAGLKGRAMLLCQDDTE